MLVKAGEYVVTESISFSGPKKIAVRSQAGAEETIIRMAEEPADPRRASVVVFGGGVSEELILEGFTLTGGTSTDELLGPMGGGVLFFSSPSLIACTITGNSTQGVGGTPAARRPP